MSFSSKLSNWYLPPKFLRAFRNWKAIGARFRLYRRRSHRHPLHTRANTMPTGPAFDPLRVDLGVAAEAVPRSRPKVGLDVRK